VVGRVDTGTGGRTGRSHCSPLLGIAAGLCLAFVAALGGVWWMRNAGLRARVVVPSAALLAAQRPDPGPPGCVRVRPGETFSEIASRLQREGWIRSDRLLRWEAHRQGWDRRVIPGWYRVRPGETVSGLLRCLARGEIEQARITIPEGWRLERQLHLLAESLWVSPESIAVIERDERWMADHHVPGPGLEGYIFPETWVIAKGEPPRHVLEQLLRPGYELWQDSLQSPAVSLGLNRKQLWTLASLVEAEAKRSEERPRISAVFWNRLRLGMRLESDPTVLYALKRAPGRVLYADLAIDSPYNTYRVAGLPPGPICSPGRASLMAAVHPEPGCQDLFFVARGDGSHVFSRSLREHYRARQVVRIGQRKDRGGKR
jgi:UPF0755 protein